VLHRLAARADALFDNLRGDLPDKLGLTYAHLAPANPKIVCAHLSAYGRDGSRAHWPGYDYLMQAEAGYLSLTGEPEGPPSRMGLSIVDLMTGLFAAFALVSGVLAARESGKGCDLDVSLFDTAVQNLAYLATWYLNSEHVQGREPRSGHPSLVPSQLYKTRDGFIFIMCNKEKFWPVLCERLGQPEWADDARFRSFKDRLANRDEVNRLLDGALSTRTTAEWLAHFAGKVPAAPVNDLKAALDNPFVGERGLIRDYGSARMVAGPVRDGASEPPSHAAPALGAETDAVLRDCGFCDGEIAALRADRVI
jgi:crotonobetainyl-CoA:carnitine CoA-transferase CaiB-like acyl-CoA transferase